MEQLDILLPRHTLEEALGEEMAKQARLRWGEGCRFMPVSDGVNYRCACGCVNPVGQLCKECGQMPLLLERAVLDDLSREAALRLEKEAEEAARQEALRRQEEKRKKRRKIRRLCFFTAGAVGVLLLSAVAFWGITRYAIPEGRYQKALAALETGDYRESHRQFTLAGEYKDAKAYLERFATPLLSSRACIQNSMTEMVYTYDEAGRQLKCVERTFAKDAEGSWQEVQTPVTYVQRYDEKGNQLVEQYRYGHSVYVYNEQGDVVSEEYYGQDGQHERTKTFLYVYDALGRVEEKNQICSEHISVNYSFEQMTRYTYDDRNRVIREESEENYPAQMENSVRTVITWRYNETGDPVERVERTEGLYTEADNCVYTTTWQYDSEGRMLQSKAVWQYVNDPSLDRTILITNTYDERGRQLSGTTRCDFAEMSHNNSVTSEVWEYDPEGRLLRRRYQVTYTDAVRQSQGGHTQTDTYTYDLLGRMSRSEYVWEGPVETIRQKKEYTYGADGMVETVTAEQTDNSTGSVTISYYNDNGLVEKEEYIPQKDFLAGHTVEYTYAYFYYPEGVPEPRQNFLEVGVSTLYGY